MTSSISTVTAERPPARYFDEIYKYPMLSLKEEQALACRWRDQQDITAADKLVTSHLRLVTKIAMGFRGYGLPVAELISEGNIGLMRAVQRFDPNLGFRLATYALWWIRAAIQEFILHSWSLVKIGTTGAQKKLFFNLRRLKGQMEAIDAGDLEPEQVASIARTLGIPERDVITMNRRLAARDHSLNATVRQDGEDEWQDWLPDEADSPEVVISEGQELSQRKILLSYALTKLNQRERHIITERWLKDDPTTLEGLSQHYGLSRERVRQIEVRGLEKLRKSMTTRRESVSHS